MERRRGGTGDLDTRPRAGRAARRSGAHIRAVFSRGGVARPRHRRRGHRSRHHLAGDEGARWIGDGRAIAAAADSKCGSACRRPRCWLDGEKSGERGEPVSRGLQVHSRRRQLAGARLPRRRRRADLLQQAAGRPRRRRRRPAVHRLRRLLGPDDPRPRAPARDRGGAPRRRRRPELRRADRARDGARPQGHRSSCRRSRWCASSAPAPRRR